MYKKALKAVALVAVMSTTSVTTASQADARMYKISNYDVCHNVIDWDELGLIKDMKASRLDEAFCPVYREFTDSTQTGDIQAQHYCGRAYAILKRWLDFNYGRGTTQRLSNKCGIRYRRSY